MTYQGPSIALLREIELELMTAIQVREGATAVVPMDHIRKVCVPKNSKLPKVKKTGQHAVFIAALSADDERCVVCFNGHYLAINKSARAVSDVFETEHELSISEELTAYDVVKFLYGID